MSKPALIGTAPDSWGVWFPDDPQQTTWERFLDEATAAGYTRIELGPFGFLPTDPHRLRGAVSRVVPYGITCLFDAIVATAHSVNADAPRARAVVLLTDGIDTASLHSGEDAATAFVAVATRELVV